MKDDTCTFKNICKQYEEDSIVCQKYQNVCVSYPYLKAGYRLDRRSEHAGKLFKYHGDKPKLFEYDDGNGIVDVFVYKDLECPYPFSITNTEDIWYHQGFYLKEFIRMLKEFLRRNDLPYFLQKKREKKIN